MRFLDDNELETLTGFKRPSRQVKWLKENGWAFEVNGAGRQIVIESHCEQRLNIRDFARPSSRKNGVPNLHAIR